MQYRKNIILDFVHVLRYCVLLERQVSTMTALEKLYYGNIAPHEYEVERGSEYDVTAKLVIRHEQESLILSGSMYVFRS